MTYAENLCKMWKTTPQNLMRKKEVARKANFKSRKSVTPLTLKGHLHQMMIGLLQHQAEKDLLMLAQKRFMYDAQTLVAGAQAHLVIV